MSKNYKKIVIFLILFFGFLELKTYSPRIYIEEQKISNTGTIIVDNLKIEDKNITNHGLSLNNKEEIKSKIIKKNSELDKILKENINLKNITLENITLSKTSINSNINNLIEIIGYNDLNYIQIGDHIFKVVYNDNKFFFGIDGGIFNTGLYDIFIFNKENKRIKTNIKLEVIYNNENLNIANITPSIIKNDIARYLVIQGNGFDKIISIQLNNNIILYKTTFEIINDNVMLIKIPANFEPGDYYFNIMSIDSIYKLDKNIFTIIN